eukprot:CAMPEP_0196131724 /NCGR_PEP_ID=MMETSP0910-20130528/1610_1 /TAXON_ID=49265 /ORGANISM="Thalassiosira rotula, Strain GSO102" /LENGTH=809 /DNA_ID=CAMNT_0041391225 /DNA_START=88 /DNA_END=2517 /DNA_ORIENTATION=+
MMPLLPLPLLVQCLLTLLFVSGACGFSGRPGSQQQQRRAVGPTKIATATSSFSNARSAAGTTTPSSSSSSVLNAGLRDLVGPYDDDYGDGGGGPYVAPSIRDERNSAFNNFGSGGFASGGNSGFGGGRNSPGFVGFDRDRSYRDGNYPTYNVAIDAPNNRGSGGFRRGGNNNARIFDNVPFDDLPGSATRRIDNFGPYRNNVGPYGSADPRASDPYNRDSDFINTNGARGGRNSRSTLDVTSRNFDDFDDVPRGGIPPGRRLRPGGVGGGGIGGVPQIYRRDFIDSVADGRSFNSLTAVEQYFEAWNRRNIPLALSCFDDNVYYDDTQFSEPFDGKDKLADHLLYVADCLPDSFYYVVDELSVGRSANSRRRDEASSPTFQLGRSRVAQVAGRRSPTISIGALWHIENEFGPLPFARGCSFFKVDPNTNLIVEAYDFPEPAVFKTGSTGLKILSVASKLVREPKRWFPFLAWITYVYIVFFSNGILPGKDIFHSDPKTWAEVQDLSFNFMFIAPATHMPTAAKLNPVLEGIFNGLLAWAFMFAGFLSDERSGVGPYGKDVRYYERMVLNQEQVLDNGIVLVPPVSITKKNLIGLVPTIVGMQFLTCAFLLPYLFCRTSERYSSEVDFFDNGGRGGRGQLDRPRRIRPLYREELDRPALVLGESKGLGVLLGAIGIFALYWGFAGRPEDFGPPIWVSDKRAVEFMKLLDKDRVAAGFVVDLWVFGIFQGWLIDDDWKRRGRSMQEEKFLRNVAKFVPFFGLASYLVFRPKYPSSKEGFDYEGFFNSRDRARDRNNGGWGGFGGDRFRDRY